MRTLTDWVRERGYEPHNLKLYYEACTHSSYINENDTDVECNERLEFMGDAVLQIWSSDTLFNMVPPLNEGKMSMIRAQTVCESALARLNKQLGWYEFLRLGHGEEKTVAAINRPFSRTSLKPAWAPFTSILATMRPRIFSMNT
ncbi:ribonuclease III domain-containing protein [Allobaculum sp. Allo2]|uniref:ribonuclease III domain-containing protein n=1 Tax=Allobaculum sp. Allo2 TaxID=2853432 RepID=UPI0034617C6C